MISQPHQRVRSYRYLGTKRLEQKSRPGQPIVGFSDSVSDHAYQGPVGLRQWRANASLFRYANFRLLNSLAKVVSTCLKQHSLPSLSCSNDAEVVHNLVCSNLLAFESRSCMRFSHTSRCFRLIFVSNIAAYATGAETLGLLKIYDLMLVARIERFDPNHGDS